MAKMSDEQIAKMYNNFLLASLVDLFNAHNLMLKVNYKYDVDRKFFIRDADDMLKNTHLILNFLKVAKEELK